MALTKSYTHKKATYSGAYAKIMSVCYLENGQDGEGKKYDLKVNVSLYADEVKDTDLFNTDYYINGVRENKLGLSDVYAALKAAYFSDWSDC